METKEQQSHRDNHFNSITGGKHSNCTFDANSSTRPIVLNYGGKMTTYDSRVLLIEKFFLPNAKCDFGVT